MCVDVGGIVELLRHPAVRRLRNELIGSFDRAFHAFGTVGELKLRTVGKHQPAPLDAHAVGHDEDQLVALDGRHHRKADAGVARGWLNNRAARLQLARALRILDHGECDAVLDRAAGIRPLRFHPHFGAVAEQPVDADVRSVANRIEDSGGFHPGTPLMVRCANRARRSSLQAAIRGTTRTTEKRLRLRPLRPQSPRERGRSGHRESRIRFPPAHSRRR